MGQTLFLEKAPDIFPGMVFTGRGAAPLPLNPRLYISILVNLRGGTDSQEKFPAEKSQKPEFIEKSHLKKFWHFFKILEYGYELE